MEVPSDGPRRQRKKRQLTPDDANTLLTRLAAWNDPTSRLSRNDYLDSFAKIIESGAVDTLEWALPGAFQIDGKPFHLHEHYPFSPLYRVSMPKTMLWKTGRQVGKTQNTAGRGVLLSVARAHFRSLFVTPLYEQIRRFSNNYVRPLIETSPLKSLWLKTGIDKSVLQRSFRNHSRMMFSFALLDSSRLRGVAADLISVDESIRIGTMVDTPTGDRPVESFQPGDPIYAIDDKGRRCLDEVVECSDHGVRECFRIELSDGSAVDATSESFIATTAGWKSVSSVIADYDNTGAGADAAGIDAGRRHLGCPKLQPALQEPARVQATRVQHGEVPGIARVRLQATREAEESRLRGVVKHLVHRDLSGLAPYRVLVSPQGPEASDAGMAGSPDLGGDRLVVSGRRRSLHQHRPLQHARLHESGDGAPGFLADATRYLRQTCQGNEDQERRQENLLVHTSDDRRHLRPDREDQTVRHAVDALQVRAAATGHVADLPLVFDGVRAATPGPLRDSQTPTVLRQAGVCVENAPHRQDEVCSEGGEPPSCEGTISFVVPQRDARGSCEESRNGSPVSSPASGSRQSVQTSAAAQAASDSGSRTLDVQTLRPRGAAGRQEHAAAVLPGLSQSDQQRKDGARTGEGPTGTRYADDRNAVDLPALRQDGAAERSRHSRAVPPGVQDREEQYDEDGRVPCETAEIVRITCVGRHRVFDLETKKHRTFFGGGVAAHNCQNFDPAHLPVLNEVLSHSDYGLTMITGTPLSKDNIMEKRWEKSSQAEWFIPCYHCSEWNIPSLDYHVDAMIGPYHDFISDRQPGIVCHKCRKPINPRPPHGRWVHRYPERRLIFSGYHVPQIILPLHFARPDKWAELVAKRSGAGNTTSATFYNEVLGESVDVGQKLLTERDIQGAAILPWSNNERTLPGEARHLLRHYRTRVLAIDWGGGGKDEVSFTALALMGLTPDNRIHVLWGRRLLTPNEHIREAAEIMHYIRDFDVNLVAHDYTGAGQIRETIMVQAGYDLEKMMAISYVRAATRNLIRYQESTPLHQRAHYNLDKTRSLLYMVHAIKTKLVQFFRYDKKPTGEVGLLDDFLALVEEKVGTKQAGDIYTIGRSLLLSDDFAQAVNIGCAAIWHSQQCWPDFAAAAAVGRITNRQEQAAGSERYGWENERADFLQAPY